MAVDVLTRLPEPAGAPMPSGDDGGPGAYCVAAAWAGTDGEHLACAVGSAGTDGPVLVWFRRTGDTLTRLPSPPGSAGVTALTWSPDGVWLAAVVDNTLTLWRRTGDTLTRVFTGGACTSTPAGLAFIADDGSYLLAGAGPFGYLGLFRRTGDTLTLVWGGQAVLSPDGVSANGVHWHPETGLILLPGFDQDLTAVALAVWRRTGDTLTRLAAVGFDSVAGAVWHPDGRLLVYSFFDGSGGSGLGVARYTTGGGFTFVGQLGQLSASRDDHAFIGVSARAAIDPSGRYVAAGSAYDPALYDYLDPGPERGLTWTRLDDLDAGRDPGTDDYGYAGDTLLPRPAPSDQGAGDVVAWCGTGSRQYLLASAGGPFDARRYGFCWYGVGLPATVSRLYVRQPDGRFALVGTAARPLSMRMPDGTLRTWPGASQPLFMRGRDGMWRQVIG